MGILDGVTLTATGASVATTYRQRPQLQETWESGGHNAVELLDCDYSYSNAFIRNILGTVWYNRNRASGLSRVIPRKYSYRKGMYGSTIPSVTSAISPVSSSTGYKPVGYGRPWYAYKMDLIGIDGVPIQQQATDATVDAGDLWLIGQSPASLTASQISGVDPVADGREQYQVHYKPFRYTVLTDAEQNTKWAANADTDGTELHRFVVRDYRFAAKNLTLPTNFLYWASDLNTVTGAVTAGKTPIPEGATKLYPTINVLMTWVEVPWYPIAAVLNCLGKVNAATAVTAANTTGNWDYVPYDDATNWDRRVHNGWPPGTLLFDGVHDCIEHTNAAGQWVLDVTYSFIYRPQGWNYFMRFETNQFEEVVTKESVGKPQANWKKLYESADFNSLFKLPIA